MADTGLYLVYVTARNIEEARTIGTTLVEERLAACVNMIEGMQSVFRWEGRVQQSMECVLIAKTRSLLVEALINRVKQLHSYSCPCIVTFPIHGGNPEYLTWLRRETQPSHHSSPR